SWTRSGQFDGHTPSESPTSYSTPSPRRSKPNRRTSLSESGCVSTSLRTSGARTGELRVNGAPRPVGLVSRAVPPLAAPLARAARPADGDRAAVHRGAAERPTGHGIHADTGTAGRRTTEGRAGAALGRGETGHARPSPVRGRSTRRVVRTAPAGGWCAASAGL